MGGRAAIDIFGVVSKKFPNQIVHADKCKERKVKTRLVSTESQPKKVAVVVVLVCVVALLLLLICCFCSCCCSFCSFCYYLKFI